MYGQFLTPPLPFAPFPGGVDLGSVVVVPTGANALFVRSTGPADYDPPALTGRIFSTLASALGQCRSGKFDTIYVLPGHSESVTDNTMLSALVDGTRIYGIGKGSSAPTFRWTATAAQWALDNNDVIIQGLKLRLEGANGVVKALNITGADVNLVGCEVEVASGATNKATIAVEIGTGANRCAVMGNVFRGTATHNVTDGIKIVAAVDQCRISDNEMSFSATAANGNIHVAAAATSLKIFRNYLDNTMTASTATIAVDNVAATGVFADNYCAILTDGTASATGIVFAGTATVKCFQNFTSDEPRKSGVLSPVVVST